MAVLDKDTKLKFPHTLIIDASAGSGKTHTLTQRFVQFVLSNNIRHHDLTNILAITFTNNAAREMKQRILEWLKKLAFGEDCDEKKQILELVSLKPEQIRKRAQDAVNVIINRYSDFHIQTIDSFMSRILHCSAVELGMPLQLDITESYRTLTNFALSITLKSIGDKITREEVDNFLKLLILESGTFPWNPVYKIQRKFEDFLKEEGKVLEEIVFEDKWQIIEEKFTHVCKVYEGLLKSGLEKKVKCKAAESIINEDIKEFIESYSKSNLPFKKNVKNKAAYEEAVQTWVDLSTLVEEMLRLYSVSHYCHYGALYKQFKKILETVKRNKEIIHFDDINKKLSQYINKDIIPEIYYRLGDILYHFLLDEFQDTDRVQWNNMQPLLEEAFSKGGSLFAVGDMKQAIYMFRKADYKIMRKIIEGIKSKSEYDNHYLPQSVIQNARVIQLKENFRSGRVILDYVDRIFKDKLRDKIGTEILAKDLTGLTEYDQYPASKEKKYKEHDGYVKAVIVKQNNNSPEKDVLFNILEDVLPRYQHSDITILAKRNAQVEMIVEWLTEKNIPSASFSSLNIRKRKIIREIMSLLQFLDSPVDDLSFASFICGDIFIKAAESTGEKLSYDDILEFIFKRACDKSGKLDYLYVWFRKHSQFKDLWNSLFEELFNKVGYYPLYDLVSLIFRIFNIFDNFPAETGFLVRFLEAISSVESMGMNNIKDFIELICEDQEGSFLEVVLPDYINAVKVMTFHKAKGLGFPVVINMLYDSVDARKNMFFEKDGKNLMIYYIVKNFIEKSPKLKRLYSENKLDDTIQNLNLLYVANTRAKKELYNVVIKKEKQNRSTMQEKPNPLDLFEDYEKGEKEKQEKKSSEAQPTLISLPGKIEMKFTREEDKNWSIARLMEIRKGEFFHEILAEITFISDDMENIVNKIVKKICERRKEIYNIGEVSKVIIEFLNLAKAREWFEKQPLRQIQQEVEYVGKDGSLYRFDRVVIDPDRIIVIDFKTGKEGMSYYRTQLKNYMKILSALNPQKIIKGYLAYLDTRKVEEVE